MNKRNNVNKEKKRYMLQLIKLSVVVNLQALHSIMLLELIQMPTTMIRIFRTWKTKLMVFQILLDQ